jgi:hypothetical protein
VLTLQWITANPGLNIAKTPKHKVMLKESAVTVFASLSVIPGNKDTPLPHSRNERGNVNSQLRRVG